MRSAFVLELFIQLLDSAIGVDLQISQTLGSASPCAQPALGLGQPLGSANGGDPGISQPLVSASTWAQPDLGFSQTLGFGQIWGSAYLELLILSALLLINLSSMYMVKAMSKCSMWSMLSSFELFKLTSLAAIFWFQSK